MGATELNCPKCGKTGTDQGQMVTRNARLTLNLGLDPDGCEGCRKTLADAGYAETVIPPEAARVLLS
jgi:hypothetical protein